MKNPGGSLKSSKVEPEQEEKYLDQFLVLTNPLLQEDEYIVLIPGKDKPVIDEDHYQRGATSEVENICQVRLKNGVLPQTKTAVRRPDGTIAILDGGQTWRGSLAAWEKTGLDYPVKFRCFSFGSKKSPGYPDYELEARLFYVLNSVKVLSSDVKIRSHNGVIATLLRGLNKDKSSLTHQKLWDSHGQPNRKGILPTTALRCATVLHDKNFDGFNWPVQAMIDSFEKANPEGSELTERGRDKTVSFLEDLVELRATMEKKKLRFDMTFAVLMARFCRDSGRRLKTISKDLATKKVNGLVEVRKTATRAPRSKMVNDGVKYLLGLFDE